MISILAACGMLLLIIMLDAKSKAIQDELVMLRLKKNRSPHDDARIKTLLKQDTVVTILEYVTLMVGVIAAVVVSLI